MILKWLQITSDCHQIVCHTEEPLEAELKWDHEIKVRVECCFNSRPPSISGMCPKKFQFNNNANGSNLLHNLYLQTGVGLSKVPSINRLLSLNVILELSKPE